MERKKSEEQCFFDPCLFRNLKRISAVVCLLFILFIWCSSTIIISGSIFHVCVRSRKLNDPNCISFGGPGISTNSGFTLSLINESSESPVYQSNTQISPVFSSISPSTAAENNRSSAAEDEIKEVVNITQNSVVSSSVSPVTTPVSDFEDSPDIRLPVSSKSQSNDESAEEELIPSPVLGDSVFTKPVIRKGIDKAKAEETANSRLAVEGQLVILRSYTAKSKPSSCEGRGIYVYDLPPKFNTDLLAKCNEMMAWIDFCKYFTNEAMGEPIPALGNGWYNSHQFSLEPIFHNRILKHPCRVQEAEKAKVFYVPFYGAIDMIRCHFSKDGSGMNDSDALSKEIVEWLKQQKTWKRNSGLDHVFVLGKITWDFRRTENVSWGSPLLELEELQNPMKLLIERQPWNINEVGVPYPTYFHPRSDGEIIAWQEKTRKLKRKYLISFAGTPHKRWESIRSILIEQCTAAPKACNFLNCIGESCVESAPVEKLFMATEFCLQPPGDSPTRKSMFDSLIAGCIPVVFDPFTAHYQYPWHFPEDHRKYSVYIDQDEVKLSGGNVIEKLVKIPLKERQEMRKYIIDELMPRLVYAQADAKLEKFEDAFTLAVNNMLERAISKFP
ncbi:xyloglucan-specific galacturonosyltransferase 1-like [Chenopodium quinoa]|uniref:xyloglucan-specific galacturonosyltransferase 1-like n=1 Tax=Chenopodium quinoa TaxID=63459 RepID=UPI000B76E594|nr:xyloglucan-specific galacturonosyltransferase 1-like [Chenopodium quinoa]